MSLKDSLGHFPEGAGSGTSLQFPLSRENVRFISCSNLALKTQECTQVNYHLALVSLDSQKFSLLHIYEEIIDPHFLDRAISDTSRLQEVIANIEFQ